MNMLGNRRLGHSQLIGGPAETKFLCQVIKGNHMIDVELKTSHVASIEPFPFKDIEYRPPKLID
jgi:hypothetical protein